MKINITAAAEPLSPVDIRRAIQNSNRLAEVPGFERRMAAIGWDVVGTLAGARGRRGPKLSTAKK